MGNFLNTDNLKFFALTKSSITLWAPLVLAFLADHFFSRQKSSFTRLIQLNPSCMRDFIFWLIYILGVGGLLAKYMPPSLIHKTILSFHLKPIIPLGKMITSATALPVIAGLLGLIISDFANYITHRLLHQSKFLWKFHSIHHSAKEMCLLTGNRTSFTEKSINDFFSFFILFPFGFSIGNIFSILFFRRFIDIIQHSNLGWTYGSFGYLFASPVNHYYHHSTHSVDYNSNYGNILSIWDHLFGTANKKMKQINKNFSFTQLPPIGLPTGEEPFEKSILRWPLIQDIAIWTQAVNTFKMRPIKNKNFLIKTGQNNGQ